MIYTSVFVLSLSSLMFEILLARFFATAQWNHLSFMVISIALFGYSAGGVMLNLLLSNHRKRKAAVSTPSGFQSLLLAAAICTALSYLVVNQIPLDYIRLPFEWTQGMYLLFSYLLLAVPFFIAGFTIALAYISRPSHIVYFSSMLGSAAGTLLPLVLVPLAGTGAAIVVSGALILIVIPFYRNGSRLLRVIGVFCLAASIIVVFAGNVLVEVRISPYKPLSQTLKTPNTFINKTSESMYGRIDLVESPFARYAPGLSLSYQGTLPNQKLLYLDGTSPLTLYDIDNPAESDFPRFSHPYAGYLLAESAENALIIQEGGGSAVLFPIALEIPSINVIDRVPNRATETIAVYGKNQVSVIRKPPRAFLQASKERFDIIHIDNWGTTMPGLQSLAEDYLLTEEAFETYVGHLSGKGVLIISRMLLFPPSDSIRMFATAFRALKENEIDDPKSHIALVRNWDSYTLIVSRSALNETNTKQLIEYCEVMSFDTVYFPGIKPKDANRFNISPEPYHYQGIQDLLEALEGRDEAFFHRYILDVRPQMDAKPYASRFIKWGRIRELRELTGGRYTLLFTGEFLVLAVFIVALLLAVVLMLTPLWITQRKNKKNRHMWAVVLYFLCLGTGFMLVEIAYIKKMIPVAGDPILSFMLVLSTMLIISGIGGRLSARFRSNSKGRPVGIYSVMILLLALIAVLSVCSEAIINLLLSLPSLFRYASLVVVISLFSIIIGMPFPAGMRMLARNDNEISLAWASNGIASVLTAIIAAAAAMMLGTTSLLVAALGAYACAFFVWLLSSIKSRVS